MKILVIEDDPLVSNAIRVGLHSDTHAVDVIDNGSEGSFMGRTYQYDIILLDHALPGKNGITVCKDIRGSGKNTPIIFLSVNNDTNTKVQALDSGADDYMIKPFSFSELRSRMKAVMRRNPVVKSGPITIHDLTLDPLTHGAIRADKRIHLTKKEFALLEYMMRRQGQVLSRSELMEHVWTADSDPFSNTVEAHVRNLRKKINIKRKADLIANIPGHGYVIDTPENLKKFA